MKPTMTIIGYLYSGRNSWLRHDKECICEAEEIIEEILDQVPVCQYMSFSQSLTAGASFHLKTADEWDEICGPKAEARVLNDMAEAHMNKAAEILAIAATKERLSSE